MQRQSLWNDGATADMPAAAAAYELCDAVRAAMLLPASGSSHERLQALTTRVVRELREEGYEPQTVLLQVKEILQRAGLGMHVDETRLQLWKAIIDSTIRAYYCAD